MEHSASTGFGIDMLIQNPLLILLVIFGLGGWLVFRMVNADAADEAGRPTDPPPTLG
jgi:hypothetical protein